MYSFISSKLGMGAVLALIFVSIGIYVAWLNNSLEDEVSKRKQAELNIQLVVSEFDKLYKNNVELQNDFDAQIIRHTYNLELLEGKHKKEIQDVIKITTIKVGISNVKEEDDGGVSNILNDTIDALRLYK